MKSRKVYSILAALVLIGVYGYNFYLDSEIEKEPIKDGQVEKSFTKNFFLPKSTTGNVVHHNWYSLSYSEPHEQAEWVAYELKKEHLSNSTNHKRPYFEIDKAVSTGAASWRNYKNSGYDRGHLCPAGDRRFSKNAHDETFLTSNISPQEHNFNSGIWNKLEQKTRYWAKKYNGVFVITGGVLSKKLKTIGKENVAVPNYFYKILIDYNSKNKKAVAFLIPHQNSQKPLYEFVVSIDEIEKLTQIDFFHQLEDSLENKLEASSSYKGWSF